MHTDTYPVRIEVPQQVQVSRWLWLVKWLLAIPHIVVLVLLWIGFVVVSLIAFVAILVTGRYPRPLFDYAVGVLRWSWRVEFYTYGVLGTDRYPPFTLADVPDYPARLHVDYPERLSRGLVLVKWWLLAIPHYLVVGILVGSGATWTDETTGGQWGAPGLIGLLVLIAAVTVAVTGRYPNPLYHLIVGLNRWTYRVAGYACLLTDTYPPFRLDMNDAALTPEPSGSAPLPEAPGPQRPQPEY
jgi:hypothetical protein